MTVAWWGWVALIGTICAMLAADIVLVGRGGREFTLRRALVWSLVWTAIGFGFTGVLAAWQGWDAGEAYLAGFMLEKSLSTDNLFVFALIFAAFSIPIALQRRVLFWGIVGAILLRAIFIFAGAALLDAFHYTLYVFAAFLVITGLRMFRHGESEVKPQDNPVLKLIGRVIPLTHELSGERLFVREGARRVATPLFAALVMVAIFDVIFAVDSIPAIFAITRDTYIVFAANAFSLLGLSALYFLLAGSMSTFRYLKPALALILVIIGVKMLLTDVWHVPVYASLGVIVATLAAGIGLSLLRPGPPAATPTP